MKEKTNNMADIIGYIDEAIFTSIADFKDRVELDENKLDPHIVEFLWHIFNLTDIREKLINLSRESDR